jgi:hypothetical protein
VFVANTSRKGYRSDHGRRSDRHAGGADDRQPNNRHGPRAVPIHDRNQVRGYGPHRAPHSDAPGYNRPDFFPTHQSHVPQLHPIRVDDAGDHHGDNRYDHRVKWGYDHNENCGYGTHPYDNPT